jgi:putative ABC transport system permease protein
MEAEVRSVPGVVSVGFTHTPPFRSGWVRSPFLAVGESAMSAGGTLTCFDDAVSVDYLRTVGIPLLAGRGFRETDTADSAPVILVSQATARRFFGTLDPLGRHLAWPADGGTAQAEIVGVVGDTRRDGLAVEAPLQVYRPLAQRPLSYATLMVRTQLPPASLTRAVQEAIWRVDPATPISDVAVLASFVNETITQPRLYLKLFGLSSALALLLAAIGLYGVVSYGVAQRTHEFGIRTALGAGPRTVVLQVLRESAALIASGLSLGLIASLAGTRWLESMIYEIPPHDPVVFVGVSVLLAFTALFACWLPARRAAHVNPVEALRSE